MVKKTWPLILIALMVKGNIIVSSNNFLNNKKSMDNIQKQNKFQRFDSMTLTGNISSILPIPNEKFNINSNITYEEIIKKKYPIKNIQKTPIEELMFIKKILSIFTIFNNINKQEIIKYKQKIEIEHYNSAKIIYDLLLNELKTEKNLTIIQIKKSTKELNDSTKIMDKYNKKMKKLNNELKESMEEIIKEDDIILKILNSFPFHKFCNLNGKKFSKNIIKAIKQKEKINQLINELKKSPKITINHEQNILNILNSFSFNKFLNLYQKKCCKNIIEVIEEEKKINQLSNELNQSKEKLNQEAIIVKFIIFLLLNTIDESEHNPLEEKNEDETNLLGVKNEMKTIKELNQSNEKKINEDKMIVKFLNYFPFNKAPNLDWAKFYKKIKEAIEQEKQLSNELNQSKEKVINEDEIILKIINSFLLNSLDTLEIQDKEETTEKLVFSDSIPVTLENNNNNMKQIIKEINKKLEELSEKATYKKEEKKQNINQEESKQNFHQDKDLLKLDIRKAPKFHKDFTKEILSKNFPSIPFDKVPNLNNNLDFSKKQLQKKTLPQYANYNNKIFTVISNKRLNSSFELELFDCYKLNPNDFDGLDDKMESQMNNPDTKLLKRLKDLKNFIDTNKVMDFNKNFIKYIGSLNIKNEEEFIQIIILENIKYLKMTMNIDTFFKNTMDSFYFIL